MASSKRITRNSYKRKVVLFGILVFLSIALISTGFASWVMSQGAAQDSTGNVEVGIVADSNLKFNEFKLSTESLKFIPTEGSSNPEDGTWELQTEEVDLNEYSFSFEPLLNDDTGRIRSDGENHEAMVLIIYAVISPEEFIDNVTITLTVPQGLKDAADQDYIILPQCAIVNEDDQAKIKIKVGGEVEDGSLKSEVDDKGNPTGRAILNYRVEFKWGSKFNYLNPGVYYDADNTGVGVSDDVAKETLEKFRATVYGYSYDEFKALSEKAKLAADNPNNPEYQLTQEELAKYQDILDPKEKTNDYTPYVEALTYKLTITANIN